MKIGEQLQRIENEITEMRKKMHVLSGMDEQFKIDFDKLIGLVESARMHLNVYMLWNDDAS